VSLAHLLPLLPVGCWALVLSDPCEDPRVWYEPSGSDDVVWGCDPPDGWLPEPPAASGDTGSLIPMEGVEVVAPNPRAGPTGRPADTAPLVALEDTFTWRESTGGTGDTGDGLGAGATGGTGDTLSPGDTFPAGETGSFPTAHTGQVVLQDTADTGVP